MLQRFGGIEWRRLVQPVVQVVGRFSCDLGLPSEFEPESELSLRAEVLRPSVFDLVLKAANSGERCCRWRRPDIAPRRISFCEGSCGVPEIGLLHNAVPLHDPRRNWRRKWANEKMPRATGVYTVQIELQNGKEVLQASASSAPV